MHCMYKYQKKKKKKAASGLLRCCFGSQLFLCLTTTPFHFAVWRCRRPGAFTSSSWGMCLGDCGKLVNIWFNFRTSSFSCFGIKQMCICPSWEESGFPQPSYYSHWSSIQARRFVFPVSNPRAVVSNILGQTTHSPGKISTHSTRAMFPFSEAPSRVTGPNPTVASLIFLPDSMRILLIALFIRESFCQFPVSFQWKLFCT